MEVIDLTQTIHNKIQINPGDPIPSINRFLTHEKDYCHVDFLKLGSHTGTHIDAPYHFLKSGVRIDEIPVQRFVGNGVLIDVSGKSDMEFIETQDIEPYTTAIEKGDFALFKTCWDQYFGAPRYFQHPFLSEESAKLLSKLGVSLVGIDAMNIDPSYQEVSDLDPLAKGSKVKEDYDYPVHDILLGNNILIVENLCNLNEIVPVKGFYSFLPLKVMGSDGSPIRAVYISDK